MASQPEANQSPVELVNFCPSPAAPVPRRSARNSATPRHHLLCPRACTGKTPGKRSSVNNLHPEFVEQSPACDRMFPSVKHDPMKTDQRMKKDGSLQRDPENNAIFRTEQGVLSCYIIAHQEKRKSIYNERKATAAVSAESSEESNLVVK